MANVLEKKKKRHRRVPVKAISNYLLDPPEYLTRAPFQMRTKRFAAIGYHPNLDPTGSMRKARNPLGPGQYDPEPYECPYKKYQFGGSPWKRKINMEEFSKELGFKFPDVLEGRRFQKTLGGPGTNDINYELFKRKTSSNKENCDFGTQKKFYSVFKHVNPPPDSYFRKATDLSTLKTKGKTPLPSFEWDGFQCRFKDQTKSWNIAPNRYKPIDCKSMDAIINKKVSKRGPYDLFTGPRDETTIKNHFSPPVFKGPVNWFNTYPNEIDILFHHPRKQKCGKFLQGPRFPKYPSMRMMLNDLSLCYRDPTYPSPATYEIKGNAIKQLPESKYAFNNSQTVARKSTPWTIQPGPGRYNVKPIKCKQKKKQSWVFKSKVQRNMYKIQKYADFD